MVPTADEYNAYYAGYVGWVPEEDVLQAMTLQREQLAVQLSNIPESQGDVVHAPYRWTIKQVIGHLLDGERVFGYRAAHFAVGDETPLPGFDEHLFVDNMPYEHVRLSDLKDELLALRSANLAMFRRFPPAAWLRRGIASGYPVSVNALAYILVGHIRHHMSIVAKRIA